MGKIRKKVFYLKGLAEGLDLSHSKEGRILQKVIEVLEDMTEQLSYIEERHDELETYMESIDEDLQDLEEDIYDEFDHDLEEHLETEIDDQLDYIEIECPQCQDVVCFKSNITNSPDIIEVTCPSCDETVYSNDGSYEIEEYHPTEKYYSRDRKTTEDI